jgi:preprotein translocase subunit SecA
MLQKRYGIDHQVLNGRPENAARENEIVANAGLQRPLKQGSKQMVGTVTIATNMAGRGTDIKLGEGVVYDKCKVPDEDTLKDLGVEPDPLYPSGVNKCCIHCEQYDASTNCAHCFKPKLDPDFPERGRTRCREEVPCGMHMVGTERHEARRIDNQLRGRSGRQGDPGSSRFFLSLRDELITIFAGEWMLKVLGWLGLQGDASIEDRRISKGIERAQKKVEERNFEIRKNLLEYDEVMDYQRKEFYSRRQTVLEGRNLEGLVMDMVVESIEEATAGYLDGQYAKRCIAEWGRQAVRANIEAGSIRGDTMDEIGDIQDQLHTAAKDEAANEITITLGEYMDDAIPPEEWDLRGLSGWAMSRFNVQLSQNQLRKMDPREVEQYLSQAAAEQIDKVDLSGVTQFLQEDYAVKALAEWARQKFDMDVDADQLSDQPDQAADKLTELVQANYHQREIEYPVEHAMDMTVGQAGTENVYAMETLVGWANRKYEAGLELEDVLNTKPRDIYDKLIAHARKWDDDDAIHEYIRSRLGDAPDIEPAIELAKNRFDTELTPEDFANADRMETLVRVGRSFLRREMTELERFVLLQILDSSWKDHLLSMDHLRDSIGLRGYAEQDPRVAYKREGAEYFRAMLAGVRDKVTDMIFKVRLTGESEMASVYEVSNTVHEQLQGYDHLAQDMADQQEAAEPQPVKQIVRDVPKVGRNDPCPCGSGKKYKKCCGKNE